MKRRNFLALSTATVGGIFLTRCVSDNSQAQPNTTRLSKVAQMPGRVEVSLEARRDTVSLGGDRASRLTYNGQIPGPKIEAKPGDSVRIRFTNNLTQPTNLHYHGLHISPSGKADNVFLKVSPGETLTYEFDIPPNHPAGTFWYHPHWHGLVADQVFGGLAGLFVIRGELDEIPEVRSAREEFVVLKDFDRAGRQSSAHHMEQMLGREGQLLTANGRVNPSLTLPERGLLRLRLLNASNARFYRLAIENHPLYLIATDGGAIANPVELSELLLSPGERAEVLVKGDRSPGRYRLLDLPYNRGGMGMMGRGMMGGRGMHRGRMRGRSQNAPQTLATLEYGDRVEPQSLPQTLLPVETLPEPETVRRFTLNHGMAPGMGMVFLINDRAFESGRIDTRVRLNAIEDWELINNGVMDHPFHLHVNHFQIVSRNNRPEPQRAWKDTVLVPRGDSIRIRIPFRDFAGKTVYHCHILDHEDLGMMGALQIEA
jgi:FtsP/CotA-like multicopper oxidase with cupredoxin domain